MKKITLLNFFVGISLLIFVNFITASFIDWTEYPTDPIYNPGTAYYPSVVYDANRFNDNSAFYKMWYATSGIIGLAYSEDGINWITQAAVTGFPNSINGSHPDVLYDPNGFGGGAYNYRMWLWDPSAPLASISAIKFSQSTDGINWTVPVSVTQDPASPLVTGISPGYFYHLYGPGDVSYFPERTNPIPGEPLTYPYVMYFDTSSEGSPGLSVEQIGLAYSVDGLFWTRYGTEPVLIPSNNSADWDGEYIYQPSIIQVNGIWHMYYSGSNGLPIGSAGNTTAHGIGHATSIDGIHWVKDANPIFYILDGVAWRNNRTYTPEVIFAPFCTSSSGSSHIAKMWFSGANSSDVKAIGYATMPCPGPLPPASFTGIIKKNNFLNRTEYVLFVQWTASASTNIAFYRIYKDGTIVAEIPANNELAFNFCSCSKNALSGYEIAAVNTSGVESAHLPLVIASC
ncbi:MAG: hypothetical protein M1114_00675 [Candidatus Dependentiae bacterium]|nr:hypothetical protein [Candidatus Dependentiae bacterium]